MRIRNLRKRMAWLSRGRPHFLDPFVSKRARRQVVKSFGQFQLAVVAAGKRLFRGGR